MKRRKFLKIAGTGGVILAAGGISFAMTRTPMAALEPWKTAGSLYTDPMRQALSYAILAPNPHNRQPWVVELKSDREAVLSYDPNRLLPTTDPFSRQIVIGLGCFLELFSLAAAAHGFRAEVQYFPQGEPGQMLGQALDQRPIAHLLLAKEAGLAANPLFAQTLNRHTNRNPYDTSRTIAGGLLQRLTAGAGPGLEIGTVNGGKRQADLRTLTRDAMRTEFETPEAFQESIDLMRIGRTEIEANPDGISLGGAFLETLSLAGILTRESLADTSSSAYRIGLEMSDEAAMSAMGFVWITTVGNSRTAQIAAGRAYMRAALQITADGLNMQPMSQALQEYSAMAPYHKTIHDWLANGAGERVQMLARLGYSKDVGPAPRWALATRLKDS
ncbi:MAG: twin-arginine translocation pathway signal protein [Rhodospirillaceae bacterium]|nr:twin-arginine translocation pathway signal protein [Rhodospirillaceae bacterium]